MTSPESHPFQLTRRRALAGAAWSAPVVVLASAVPAFAVSPGSTLDLRRGSSAAVLGTDGTDNYFDLQFVGLSVVVPGTGVVPASDLKLTVIFSPTNPGGPATMVVLDEPAPASNWVVSPAAGNTQTTVVFTYVASITGGSEVQMPTGIYVGANQPTSAQSGTYVVTASAPGFTMDSESFATPPPRAALKAGPPIMRPKV